MDMLEEHT